MSGPDIQQNTAGKQKRLANLTNAGKGRPKGALNKNTLIAKDAIAAAAEKLGGVNRLVAWAKEDDQNERVFWGSIYPKLLPLQVTGQDGDAIRTALTVTFKHG